MQDPNADTEWNDILRQKGILPPKQEAEVTEDDIVQLLEDTIQQKSKDGKTLEEMDLDELDEMEDEIDEEEQRIYENMKRQRMAEMMASQAKDKFGDVLEISKQDYVREVNEAGEGVWVVLHVYKDAIPLCKLINHHMTELARKFRATKFIKSVSSVCIPNYPDKNLPTIFVYYEGDMKKNFIGPLEFGGMNLTKQSLEWILSQTGAVKTDLEEDPRGTSKVKDVMSSAIRDSSIYSANDDE